MNETRSSKSLQRSWTIETYQMRTCAVIQLKIQHISTVPTGPLRLEYIVKDMNGEVAVLWDTFIKHVDMNRVAPTVNQGSNDVQDLLMQAILLLAHSRRLRNMGLRLIHSVDDDADAFGG